MLQCGKNPPSEEQDETIASARTLEKYRLALGPARTAEYFCSWRQNGRAGQKSGDCAELPAGSRTRRHWSHPCQVFRPRRRFGGIPEPADAARPEAGPGCGVGRSRTGEETHVPADV